MNTKDSELVEIDGCKINKGQAPLVQKVDSAIHWLNIISIYQIRHKKFSRVLIGSRNSEYPQAIHCFVPFSPCSPCSPSSPVAPILFILLVPPNPLVPPCSPVPHVPFVPLFPGSSCSLCSRVPLVPPVLLVLSVPLFPSVCFFPLFPSPPCSPCSPLHLVSPIPLFPLLPFSLHSPVPLVPLVSLFPLFLCSSFPVLCSVLSVLFLWRGVLRLCYPVSNTVRSVSLGTVLGLESCFVFAVCAFMNKVSMILKIIQQKYQLKKNN